MKPFVVPPGGFTGFAQMTPASQAALGRRAGTNGGTRRRRRRKGKTKAAKRSGKRTRKLKFGSPAWRKKYNKKK